jgi:hypothetical protein
MSDQILQALQQSIERILFKVATLLPGVLALVLALVIFAALGWVMMLVLRRVLISLQFDAHSENWGMGNITQWAPTISPTLLVSRIAFWIMVIIGLMIGIAAFDASSASGLAAYMMTYLSKVVAAIVVLVAGTFIARFLSRSVLINGVNMNLQHARLLSLGVKWLVLVFTGAMVLDHLGIARSIVDLGFGILFGGIVLALALAVGLGSRDLVSRSLQKEQSNRPSREEETLRHF